MTKILKVPTSTVIGDWGLPNDENYELGIKVLENRITGQGRWSTHYKLIVKLPDGNVYETTYQIGSTEYQDVRPFEDTSEVTFYLVKPVEHTVIEYVRVTDDE